MPLISNRGHSQFTELQKTSPCDNVLLELRLALELKEMGMIDAIFPVLVGDEQSQLDYKDRMYTKFSSWSTPNECPDCEVDSVEEKLAVNLDEFGLGYAMSEHRTVKQVYSTTMGYQAAFLEGNCDSALSSIASKTIDIFKRLKEHGQATSMKRASCRLNSERVGTMKAVSRNWRLVRDKIGEPDQEHAHEKTVHSVEEKLPLSPSTELSV